MILVDLGMYYFAIVLMAVLLIAVIILTSLLVRWIRYAQQYKGLWKEATTKIRPIEYDPYEKQKRSIHYEYLEGLD